MAQRILQGAVATLTTTFLDQNGSPADAAGAVTVGVNQADGTVVLAAGTAAAHGTAGVYTVALSAAQTAAMNLLTATWTDAGNSAVHVSTHEIVGGFLFSIADARAADPTLSDQTKYPDAAILLARQEVEEECEMICDRAFVPRYRRETLSGASRTDITLSANDIRIVRSVRVYNPPGSSTFITLTASQLAGLSMERNGTITRTDFAVFDEGMSNVIVECEFGLDRPPTDLKRAALIRLRTRLNLNNSGINDRALSWQSADGGTYRLDTADAWKTGIPEVDAAYNRWSLRNEEGGSRQPVSRSIDMDSQRYELYHGGTR